MLKIDVTKVVVRLSAYAVLLGVGFLDLLFALIVIFTERHSPTSTIAWLMVVLFIPLLGFIFYLLFGVYFPKNRNLDALKATVLASDPEETNDPIGFQNPASLAHYWDLIRLNLASSASVLSNDNTVEMFSDGKRLFTAFFGNLAKAQLSIYLESYIIRDDDLGRQLREILTDRASHGVEVKLLYDGLGSAGLPKDFFTSLTAAGAQVVIFFPPRSFIHVNYRNHRKIGIIDGHTAFLGGFNVGNEYLGLSKLGYWRDLHLCMRGSAVEPLALRFMLDWKLAGGGAVALPPSSASSCGDVALQIVSSGPGAKWPAIMDSYLKIITTAKSHIVIETPYLVPPPSLLDALRMASLSGVEVKIIVPQKPDHPFVHWVTQSYFEELLQAGVRIFTYANGFIHSKAITADGTISCIGTANFDVRSFRDNYEVNAVIYNQGVTRRLEEIIAEDLRCCTEVRLQDHWQRGRADRVKEVFCRLLSPLL